MNQDTIKGLYALAYQMYENGKYNEAEHFFKVLTFVEKHKRKHWMGLAASQQMQKKYEDASHSYGVAALHDETDPYAHLHAAECFFGMKEVENGMLALESAEMMAKKEKKYDNLIPQIDLLKEVWGNGVNKNG